MSKFYIVATPIGNMQDITLRAIEILKEVDLILCEDTRETKKILDKYGINSPTMSYHAQSKLTKIDKIFELLKEGKNFSIIELNGSGSEPTHMYDPKHSVFFAWREILRHWDLMCKISIINHKRGVPYMTRKEGLAMLKANKQLVQDIS